MELGTQPLLAVARTSDASVYTDRRGLLGQPFNSCSGYGLLDFSFVFVYQLFLPRLYLGQLRLALVYFDCPWFAPFRSSVIPLGRVVLMVDVVGSRGSHG